jgi:hypothetical protein
VLLPADPALGLLDGFHRPMALGLAFQEHPAKYALPRSSSALRTSSAASAIMAAISSRRAGKSVAAAPSSSSIQGMILLSLIGLSPVIDLGGMPGLQVLY